MPVWQWQKIQKMPWRECHTVNVTAGRLAKNTARVFWVKIVPMSDKKNNANALFNSLSASGEDLPLLQPDPPPENADFNANSMEQVSLESSPFSDAELQADFAESDAVFSELRNFGQTGQSAPSESLSPQPFDLNLPDSPADKFPPNASPSRTNTRPASTANARAAVTTSSDFPVTTAESLPGWKVDSYLGLVSAWVRLDSQDDDPLAEACKVLAKNAMSRGATAVLSAKLQATGEAQGLLLVGTAVVSSRE
jgi:hypothetical protein